MKGLLIVCALALATLPCALAGSWPQLPAQKLPVTIDEVKDYWFNHLQRPTPPRTLERRYKQKMTAYFRAVSKGRSKIKSMRQGSYDEEATLAVLRHNIAYCLAHNDPEKAAELSRQLTAILEAQIAIAQAKREREKEPLAVAQPSPDPEPVEEQICEPEPQPNKPVTRPAPRIPYCPPSQITPQPTTTPACRPTPRPLRLDPRTGRSR